MQPSVGQNDGEAGSSQGPGFAGLPGGLNAPHQSLGLGNDSQQDCCKCDQKWQHLQNIDLIN